MDSSPAVSGDRVFVGSDDGWFQPKDEVKLAEMASAKCLKRLGGLLFWGIFLVNFGGGFSVAGGKYVADFGEKVFHLQYESMERLVLTEVRGPEMGRRQVLKVQVTELRLKLFLVTWREDTGLTNVDIEDYENGVVYANMTTSSGNFISAKGTLKQLE